MLRLAFMINCDIVVRQQPGYYVLDLMFFLESKNIRLPILNIRERHHRIQTMAAEIDESFDLSGMVVDEPYAVIKIKCKRRELRKIETWLAICGHNLVPLRRWKNEAT